MVNAADGRSLDPLEAYDAVMRFAARRGTAALHLAMHAAMPQVLRPELVHQLRINFVPEANGDLAVEADVLFAPFCADLGNGYYQFDAAARLLLLQELDPTCTDALGLRSRRLAEFMTVYVDAALRTPAALDPLYRDYLEVEAWVALGFLDPDAAAEQLAMAIAESLEPAGAAARVQIGGIAGALAIPLTQHHRVVTYAEALDALDDGDDERGRQLFGALGSEGVQAGAVTLPSPSEALGMRGVTPVPEVVPLVEQEADVPEAESDMPPAGDPPNATTALQATVLISCVRADLALADRIVQSLAKDGRVPQVELLTGAYSQQRIDELFSGAAILLQLVSPNWPSQSLLHRAFLNPEHQVRLVHTLEQAFVRGIPVALVLLGGFQMPAADQFPAPVRRLAERTGLTLSEDSWERDIERIVDSMASLPIGGPVRPTHSADVFLTSTPDGRELVVAVGRVLRDRGINVWDPIRSIRSEQLYADEMARALERSAAVVVILTAAAEQSTQLLSDLEAVSEVGLPILPVLIGDGGPSGVVGDILRRWPGTRMTRMPEQPSLDDLHRILNHVLRILNQRSGELRTESAKPAQDNVAADLEQLLGPDGTLITVPLEEFEQRRHQALSRLEKTPLPRMLVTSYLDSDVPVQRLIAYCQLQATPDPEQLTPLLGAWAKETTHARESRETRCLWNLLEALHQYRYTGVIGYADVPAVIDAAARIDRFLSRNDDLDPGRQCRNSVQRLLELLSPPSA